MADQGQVENNLEQARMGTGLPTPGRMVTYHSPAGSQPAMVTRVNVDGTLSLTVFLVGDIVYRDNVPVYEYDPEDEDQDKYGTWEWPARV